jgi:myo-inositol-1(or 4)-monophosphatase
MNWDHEHRILGEVIRSAGAEALRLASAGFETHTKSDQSPVTSADLAVNQILESHLLALFPDDGWLSEESPDNALRLKKSRVWVIDPIDGTKAFIRREPEYCISVALVEDGRPVVAAIFNPSTDELFSAMHGGGLYLNQQPIDPREESDGRQPIIALGPWEQQTGRFQALESKSATRPMKSIAWALALTACGRIHATATFEPENEWDVAAGALLIEEAGGTMQDGGGQALAFNRPEPRYHGIMALGRHCPSGFEREIRTLFGMMT